MGKAYDKDFLIDVYMSRFDDLNLAPGSWKELKSNAEKLYDKVGKTEWRKYADVTPERIREYDGISSI